MALISHSESRLTCGRIQSCKSSDQRAWEQSSSKTFCCRSWTNLPATVPKAPRSSSRKLKSQIENQKSLLPKHYSLLLNQTILFVEFRCHRPLLWRKIKNGEEEIKFYLKKIIQNFLYKKFIQNFIQNYFFLIYSKFTCKCAIRYWAADV